MIVILIFNPTWLNSFKRGRGRMFSLGYLGQFTWGKWLQATIQTLSKSSLQYMCGEKKSTLRVCVCAWATKPIGTVIIVNG
jgi:hypothetical protein